MWKLKKSSRHVCDTVNGTLGVIGTTTQPLRFHNKGEKCQK